MVPYKLAYSAAEVFLMHAEHMAAGYEGTIVRKLSGEYKFGTATAKEGTYLRIKDFVDDEAVVVSLTQGKSNQNDAVENPTGGTERSSAQAGMVPVDVVGSLVCHHAKFGQIDVGAGEMDHTTRAHYWAHPEEIVGKVITFKHMPYGAKDAPRFPTFKCIRENDE